MRHLVQVVERPSLGAPIINPEGEQKWSVDGLHDTLASHFDVDHRAVLGGFSMPAF